MRPLLALLISVVILGGLSWFLTQREIPVQAALTEHIAEAEGKFSVEVTATFDAKGKRSDEFAVSTEPSAPLSIRVAGQPARTIDNVVAGKPIVIENLQGLIVGENELLIEANPLPVEDNALRAYAVRVRVLRDGETMSDTTLWTRPGLPLSERIRVQIPAPPPEPIHDDHE